MAHKYDGTVKRCPNCDFSQVITKLHGFTDWALVNCRFCGDILVIAPEFIPFVEIISKDTALFYCYDCGETEAWGNVPKKFKATTPCKCFRK